MSAPLIVVSGASGQLGRTFAEIWPTAAIPAYSFLALDRTELDISEPEQVDAVLSELRPAVIINAAAYTQVDKAESDSDNAHLINATALEALAGWAARNDSRFFHISTDFVFDGSGKSPYRPDQEAVPVGVYGASKLAGEEKLSNLAPGNSVIVRTSWLYSEHGNNFVKTMLRLMGERDELSVVDDQIGSPTSTHSLANLIFAMIQQGGAKGIYHWTDGASISWYEFAKEIQKQALSEGLLEKAITIHPIKTEEYPTPARRPAYSVLDRGKALDEFDCPGQDWQEQLSIVIRALAA
ncbi:MAG: NAD(P)-dependent oxidoreductase [Pseudohongiella sp.]|nr:MAG: NAD(P)-dependent oxidoreductase [Pseudohongiella sp.]